MEDMGLLLELAEEVAELKARVAVLEASEPKSRFEKPTVDQVRQCMMEYCKGEKLTTKANPQEFIDFYNSNGWKVGKVSMKDWEAAARNWARRGKLEKLNSKGSEAYTRHGL